MTTRRHIGRLIAALALFAATRVADPAIASGIRYAALAYMAGDFVLLAWAGYLRRRPHWTTESWRRFLGACLVPIGALAVMFAMTAAVDRRLPIVGAPRSTLRLAWAAGALVFMLVGAVGLATVVGWLASGDAARPFELPRWLRRRRGGTA